MNGEFFILWICYTLSHLMKHNLRLLIQMKMQWSKSDQNKRIIWPSVLKLHDLWESFI